jgi:nucleoside-diphosphate-sugar epimerase
VKLLVTGTSGFIGRHVLSESLARGHEVIGLSRMVPKDESGSMLRPHWIRHDLGGMKELALNGLGIDVVIHLAAGLAGSVDEQHRATVQATRHLIEAMRRAGIRKLVGISSMAVLDYPRMPALSLIDERTATADGTGMGIYARMKFEQEGLFAGFAGGPNDHCVILRPGLVYDEKRLHAAHAGVIKGSICILASHGGEVPVVEVGGLARAIVNAAERDIGGGEIIHLVDDNLPGQPEYMSGLRRRQTLPATGMFVPWCMLAALAWVLRATFGVVGQRRRLPESLLRHGFAARLKPFRYSNDKAKRLLGWVPAARFS